MANPIEASTAEPSVIIQRQLDAYNAKDLEGLLAIYAADAEFFEHPAKLVAAGTTALRQRFAARFQEPNLHAHLLNRIAMGNIVIDHELVTRTFAEGEGTIQFTMIYEVQNGQIRRSWLIAGPQSLLRQATPADATVIAALTDAAYQKYVTRLGRKPQPMTADYATMASEHSIWLLCEVPHGEPIGLLVLQHEPDAMLIYSVAIHPNQQRKGLGKYLLNVAEAKARQAGYAQIRLYTNERMSENLALYQQMGYRETHREAYQGTMTVYMAKAV